jgi:outer membrane protein OmpA-like peptidoglycan-associated protein
LRHNFLLRGFFRKRGYDDASELTRNAITRLPAGPRAKEFTFDADRLFDKPDGASLKNKKALDEAGMFLEHNKFGLAVITADQTTGDTAKSRVVTEARAKVIRDYLASNFTVDDTHIKTLGLGKVTNAGPTGKVQILVYSAAAASPAQKDSGKVVGVSAGNSP